MKDLAGRAKRQAEARRSGRHRLAFQHGHVRHQAVRCRHQPAAGHDPGDRRGREASLHHRRRPGDRDRHVGDWQLRSPRDRRCGRCGVDEAAQGTDREPDGDARLSAMIGKRTAVELARLVGATGPRGGADDRVGVGLGLSGWRGQHLQLVTWASMGIVASAC